MDRRVRIGRVLPLMAITGWLRISGMRWVRISGTHTLPSRHGLGVRNDRSERAVFVRARELGSVLTHELRGRRERNVYVEGDDCVAWANVVDVLDIAHSNGESLPCSSAKQETRQSVFWDKAAEDLISARQVRSGSYSR
jgi:hypothetical protein